VTDSPTIFITGATDGLGLGLARRLADEGAQLILHGRNPAKLDRVADDIQTKSGTRPQVVVADLAELQQVRDLAARVRRATERLDVFVSNAGIGSGLPDQRSRQTSVDGHELRFAVNYLAGFLLTLELLPLLRQSSPARIVNVASIGQHPLDFDDLMLERQYDGRRAYGQSKLAQIMSGFELADRLPVEQIAVNSLHPATYMPTKIVVQEIGDSVDSLDDGIAAVHRLVSDEAMSTTTGRFFDRTREAKANTQAYDPAARAELWQRSLKLVDHRDPQ
jgi:NAD(P)-dependent dehydrogenase (short-subunit alcohol dehydrogenase family)